MSPSKHSGQPRDDAIATILAVDYLDDFTARPTSDIRAMRDDCEQQETRVSYARRLVQAKVDIVRAEVQRRDEDGDREVDGLLGDLPAILAGPHHAPGDLGKQHATRFLVPLGGDGPSDQLDSGPSLGDLPNADAEQLRTVAETLALRERELSDTRRALFGRIDALKDELTRRYKTGEADVSEILAPPT